MYSFTWFGNIFTFTFFFPGRGVCFSGVQPGSRHLLKQYTFIQDWQWALARKHVETMSLIQTRTVLKKSSTFAVTFSNNSTPVLTAFDARLSRIDRIYNDSAELVVVVVEVVVWFAIVPTDAMTSSHTS